MSGHAEILDERERLRGAFAGAIALHAGIIGGLALSAWMAGHTDSFGAPDAGGAAIGIEAVNTIPLPHSGPTNPLANDSASQVPQTPAKPIEREKKEPTPPDAVKLKTRRAPKHTAEVASERQKFRPFDKLEPNQVTSKLAPQVSSPLYSAMPGSGRVGPGIQTTLGNRFAGYAAQIQQIVAQHWSTTDVDPRFRSAPVVIATFDLMRDGSVRNVALLQTSGIPTLDASVQRAILQSSPFPPIPPGFEKSSAKVEFSFELKR
jgi:TonB family protein